MKPELTPHMTNAGLAVWGRPQSDSPSPAEHFRRALSAALAVAPTVSRGAINSTAYRLWACGLTGSWIVRDRDGCEGTRCLGPHRVLYVGGDA